MNIFTIQEKNIVSYRNGKLKEGENDKEIWDISVILSSNIIYKVKFYGKSTFYRTSYHRNI